VPGTQFLKPQPRWVLVLLAWTGGIFGWFSVPWAHDWLDPLRLQGGGQAVFAVATVAAIHFVLLRTVLDMLTDLRDWRYVHREDPLCDRLAVINGRLGWGASILMIWTNVESLIGLILGLTLIFGGFTGNNLAGVEVMLSKSAHQWWREFVGLMAATCACVSLLIRNSNPVFPLPYRWLGLARNATPEEARSLLWAWSRHRKEG